MNENSSKPAAEEAPPEAPPEAPANAVLIIRAYDGEGNLRIAVQRLGDVQVAEVLTILELGVRQARDQILGATPS